MRSAKILEFKDLSELRARFPGKKIVHCHGVFDVLHAGHLAYFESAKKWGDLLVVTLTADEHVNKGPGRPYFNATIRAHMISALSVVDFTCVNRHPTAVPAIETLKPDFYVKGPDYRDMAKDPTGAIYTEERAAESGGGKLVFTDDPVYSSSSLLNEFFHSWNEDQLATIEAIKQAGGMKTIERVLADVAKLKLFLAGEPIVDTYVFCRPEALSSKSSSISAKFLYQEDYAGGTLAIANHLADFVGDVELLISHGGELYFKELLAQKMDRRVRIAEVPLPHLPTPRKTRFITEDKIQRMFELTDLRSDQWLKNPTAQVESVLREKASASDMTIAADFGHGFFEGPLLGVVSALTGFVALNVQTNSSNFGFNPFTKHSRFNYLSVDLREARVAFHDRNASHLELLQRVRSLSSGRDSAVSMTLGPGGAYFIPLGSRQEIKSPAFADSVIDAVGAGDAYFALTSVLVKVGCPDVLIPFLGNVFAGLKTKIIGNKSSVSRAALIKAATSILK